MENLKNNCVVGDVIDTVPANVLQVQYSGTAVNFGNELTPQSTSTEPTLNWPKEDGAMYTVVMVDPDAPSRQRPTAAEWLHWLVINIQGNAKEEIIQYNGPTPPKGTGLHRYVLLVFKQNKRLQMDEKDNKAMKKRANFHIKQFAQKHNLGDAIAANFFQAQNK
ncbi:phosphatidylethanolamine binding protein-like isoform 1 [Leptotrombidium deliense]|uniref:Phosphatidylethanolamine binding protein-like isoform 1 n=1 Tax=Leptotrombidium deliense TaxID=299467 RepID=A0A443S9X5_9ACAR|nr:phosphatidylethanolamine binding protein-like isoform 1 [Leptotrombidium deliense]